MIINSITLDNFRSHKHSVINLNEGISAILGENGAGKSSIFEAISYSFFKTFNGKVEDLFRKPADENDAVNQMKVTVEFEHDSNHYKLIRGKKKSSNIAKLYHNNPDDLTLICEGDNLVTREIESKLNLDSKSFLNAVYIRQGEITDLIEKTAAEKKELIAKLLNIDSLQKASDDLKAIIDVYNNTITENNVKLSEKDGVNEDIERLTTDIDEKDEELKIISPAIENLRTQLKDLEIKVLKSDNDKHEYVNLNNQIEQQKKLVNTIQENKQSNESKLQEISKCEAENVKLKKYVEQLEHLRKLKDYKTELDKHVKQRDTLNETIGKIEENKKVIEESKENYEKYEKSKTEIEELEEKKSSLEKEVTKNQEITFQLNELNTKKEELFENINNTSESAKELFGQFFKGPNEIEIKVTEETKKYNDNIQKLTEKLNNNDKEISVIKNNLANTKKSLKDLENTEDTCPICQSTITHEKHLELSEEYKQNISTFNDNLDELNKENEKFKEDIEESKKHLEQIETINIDKLNDEFKEFNDILTKTNEIKESLPDIKEKENQLEEVNKELDEHKTLSKNLEKDYEKHKIALEILKDLPDIDDEKQQLDDVNSIIRQLKEQSREIMRKYNVKDDFNPMIKYAEEQVEKFNQNKGKIQGKDNLIKEKESLINDLTSEENKLKEFEDKINNLKYDEDNNKRLHESYTSHEEELEKSILKENTLVTEIKNKKQQLEEKNKKLQELTELSEEQDNLEKYVELLKDIRELYGKDGVQKELRNNARPDIEKHTMDFFNEFDFDYTSLELDEDYNITIENKNERLDLKLMSGGEKIVIALALRLGIASTVSKNRTDLLLLDEPTIHLDAERRQRLIEIIRQIRIVPQMIVVSHDDEMESISNNIIKIVKENGISYVDNS